MAISLLLLRTGKARSFRCFSSHCTSVTPACQRNRCSLCTRRRSSRTCNSRVITHSTNSTNFPEHRSHWPEPPTAQSSSPKCFHRLHPHAATTRAASTPTQYERILLINQLETHSSFLAVCGASPLFLSYQFTMTLGFFSVLISCSMH